MLDPYAYEERIAIMIDSHIPEYRAIELGKIEQQSLSGLQHRIAALAQNQSEHKSIQPQHINIIKRTDTAILAAGDN